MPWPSITEGVTKATKGFFESIKSWVEEDVNTETSRAETAEGLALQKSKNLEDLASASTARANLGLGTAATQASSAFDAAGAAASAQAAAEAASDPKGTAAALKVSSANTLAISGTPSAGEVLTATSGTAADWTNALALALPLASPALTIPARPTITGTTYYVSATGNDANAGTSEATAWKTVKKVNETKLNPGDGVLFEGGATFGEELYGNGSGTEAKPVVYSSYGHGNAILSEGISLYPQGEWVVIDHITSLKGIGGYGSNVTIQNCNITNAEGVGINITCGEYKVATKPAEKWKILCNYIHDTGDSGILIEGIIEEGEESSLYPAKKFVVEGNVIENTGTDTAISYGKHGIYLKGTECTITRNVIRNFSTDGISQRYGGNTVENNVITSGYVGIGFFQYSSTASSTSWINNAISEVETGIYVPEACTIYSGGKATASKTSENFVLRGNIIGPIYGGESEYVTIKTTGTVSREGTNAERKTRPHEPWTAKFNSQSGTTYTLQRSDIGKTVVSTSSSATTFTIPKNIFTLGAQVNLMQKGSGALTIAAGEGVTLHVGAGGEAKAKAQYAAMTVTQIGENEWLLSGEHK